MGPALASRAALGDVVSGLSRPSWGRRPRPGLQQEKDYEDSVYAGSNISVSGLSFIRDWEKRYPSHKRCQAQLSEEEVVEETEEGNVNEEINHRNNLLFETLMNKWTK